MKKEELFNIIGEADEQKVAAAGMALIAKKKSRPAWLKWGIVAACLCIVIAISVLLLHQDSQNPGVGYEAGNYSFAVYPASEEKDDVASADVVSLTEDEALNNDLAEYLPKQLPDGFHYGRGSLYNTVMKDGTQYNMLRVEYITGTIHEQQYAEDGGAIAPDPYAIGEFFTVSVMNYEPKTRYNIYSSADEVTLSSFEESRGVCVCLGDYYVIVFAETADEATVFEAVKNLGCVADE